MAENASEIPRKEFYKLAELCEYTDVQPYVLRFWESEFPQLAPERGGSNQPLYRHEHIELVRRIKQLLHEEECTLAAARQRLGAESRASELEREQEDAPSSRTPRPKVEPVAKKATSARALDDVVPRQRYEDAIDEIETLRLQVREAEKLRRKAELAAKESSERADVDRARMRSAIERLESLIEALTSRGAR